MPCPDHDRQLVQQIGTARSQVTVENRRVAEATAGVRVAVAGADLAYVRLLNNQNSIAEWDAQAPTLLALGVMGSAIGGAAAALAAAALIRTDVRRKSAKRTRSP